MALKAITDLPALPRFFVLTNRKHLAASLMQAGLQHQKDRMFLLNLGPTKCVVATHPDVAHAILARPNDFVKAEYDTDPILQPLYTDSQGKQQSLVMVNGEKWTRMRKLMNPAFAVDVLNQMVPKFVEESKSVQNLFDQKVKDKEPIDVRNVMGRFAMDVLGSAVLDRKFGAVEGKFSETVDHYQRVMTDSSDPLYNFFPFLTKLPLARNRKLAKSVTYMTQFFNRCIAERIEEHKTRDHTSRPTRDFLDFILPDPTEQNKELCLKPEELLPNLWVFFFAGHDTTGTSLTWLMLTLAARPDIQEKAREEALRVVGKNGNVTYEHLEQIPYISAVINENLRLNPPVYNIPTRMTATHTTLDGCFIPERTMVSIHVAAVNRNPEVWPNPNEFDPERFLSGRVRSVNYMPFSAGPRRCIGDRFSLMEQKTLMLQLLTRFRILPHQNTDALSNEPMPLLFRIPQTAFINLEQLN